MQSVQGRPAAFGQRLVPGGEPVRFIEALTVLLPAARDSDAGLAPGLIMVRAGSPESQE